jgi:signal transduction histidine kinase
MPGVRATAARLVTVGLPAVALAYALAVVVAVPRGAAPLRTYAGASTLAYALDLAAGLALLAAGCIAWSQTRLRRTAVLAILAGTAWFAPDWEGWDGGPTVVRSLGAVTAPLFVALVVQLALAFPSGRARRRAARVAVLAVSALAAAVGLGWALFRDPFADPGCWRNCDANAFLVHADAGLALGLRDVWLRATVAIGVLLAAIVALRLSRADPYERRGLLPVLAPAALLALGEAAYAGALVHTRLEDPHQTQFTLVFDARAAAATALALGLGWSVATARRTRTTVSRLAAELLGQPPPGALAERLAAALGDPDLEVAYWLPNLRRYVDGCGRRVDTPVSRNGRAATPLVRGGDPVAVVVHDAALLDGERLEKELGASARLAVDNERLHAEVVARLADLRESRIRIVQSGDVERRRLERDLHDGAQQRLLALSYDLRLAAAVASAGGDADAARLLASALGETQAALDDLRDLARGIYPAILTEAGLGPALATLADTAPIPVTLTATPDERYSQAVETSAYVAVVEAIEDAASRSASFVGVQLGRELDRLAVTIDDDGRPRPGGMTHLEDRVGALGGSLELGPTTLRAEIPCA